MRQQQHVAQLAMFGLADRGRLLWRTGSVHTSQHELMVAMLGMHSKTGLQVDLDPTYGRGAFYRRAHLPPPKIRSDLVPRARDCMRADFRALPLPDRSLRSIIFDPPFLAEGGKGGVMRARYTTADSLPELIGLYRDGLCELVRVLAHRGAIFFKCQDSVHDHMNIPYMAGVVLFALSIELYLKDCFVLVSDNRLTNHNIRRQDHSRKMHSYWLVLQKHPHYAGRIRELMGGFHADLSQLQAASDVRPDGARQYDPPRLARRGARPGQHRRHQ